MCGVPGADGGCFGPAQPMNRVGGASARAAQAPAPWLILGQGWPAGIMLASGRQDYCLAQRRAIATAASWR